VSPQLHCSEQQSVFAWQRRPVSCVGMQQRPDTQMVEFTMQSLVAVQQIPTPICCEYGASGGGDASAAQHGVIATSLVVASAGESTTTSATSMLASLAGPVVVPHAQSTKTKIS
jgi:hypothetical protein